MKTIKTENGKTVFMQITSYFSRSTECVSDFLSFRPNFRCENEMKIDDGVLNSDDDDDGRYISNIFTYNKIYEVADST